MTTKFRRSAPVFAPLAAFAWMAAMVTSSFCPAEIAVLKEGATDWNVAANWTIDGQPATVIPGRPERAFWSIIIDEGDTEANVFLEAGPRQIHALSINGGDTLQIKEGANLIMRTDALEQGGNVINNSGLLAITQQGQFVLQGNNTPNPDDDIVTLSGGGVIALDSQLRAGTTLGARIIGQGGQPRVLLNEDNTIRGHGDIGRGTLKIINRGNIVANEPDKVLTIDPGSGSSTVSGDYTNDGGTARATNRGVLRLIAGTFNNINGGRIVAERNSTVELAFGAHISGGLLQAIETGRIVVTGDTFFNGIGNGRLSILGNIEVENGHELILQGDIENSGTTTLRAGILPTQLTVDGDVRLVGDAGVFFLTTDSATLSRASVGAMNPGSSLTISGGQRLGGTGTIEGPLSILNRGTIFANENARTLAISLTDGNTMDNTGTLEAIGGFVDPLGGTLHLLRSWRLTGDGSGTIRAMGRSQVVLDGVTIQGQTFKTPGNSSAADPMLPIDTTQGVIRANGVGSLLDVRDSLLKNEGLVEVPNNTGLTLIGKPASGGLGNTPALENRGTFFLNAAAPGPGAATLNITGGDVRLTGGGRIAMSASDGNGIDQSVLEQRTNTLINVDNTIEGAGSIGRNRLNFRNESEGTVRATSTVPLVIDPPQSLVNSVLPGLAENLGIWEAVGGGRMELRGGHVVNSRDAVLRAVGDGSMLTIDGGTARNEGLIESMSGGGIVVQNGVVENAANSRIRANPRSSLTVQQSTVANEGAISADGQLSLTLVSQSQVTLHSGALSATLGGLTRVLGSRVSRGLSPSDSAPSIIAATDSRVELGGGTEIDSVDLATSGSGVIRVIDAATMKVPTKNTGHLQIVDGATARWVDERTMIPDDFLFNDFNPGMISLNAESSTSKLQLDVVGRFGHRSNGSIVLSDMPGNSVESDTRLRNGKGATIRGAGTLAVSISNYGEIISDGVNPLIFPKSISSFGSIRAQGAGGIQLSSAANGGLIEVVSGSRIRVANQITNSLTTTSNLFFSVNRSEVGIIRIESGAAMVASEVVNESFRDPIGIEELGNLRPLLRSEIVIDGTFEGLLTNDGGLVSGDGLLNGQLVSDGKFTPGKSPGSFTINGSFEQLSGGELEIELAGMGAGDQYDQVVIEGEAVLGGTVVTKYLEGFAPEAGAEFSVVSATTLVDNGFTVAMLDGGLVRPSLVDVGDGTTALRLTSMEGVQYAAVSGSWDEAANWSSGSVPDGDDTTWIVGDSMADTIVTGPASDQSVFSLVVGTGEETATSATTLELDAGVITTIRGTTLRRDARLTGDGMLGGNLYSAGTIAPGSSPGTIQITGDYNQNEVGTLAIEIGGMTPGEEHDQLHVGGTAALDGGLDVSLVDLGAGPYQPAGGERFTILTADEAVAGGFASFNLPALEENLAWDIDYLTNSVELRTFLRGDYNNNGAVEQADLDLVLLNWGADLEFAALPDEWINQRPSEGLIDQAELDLVLLNWGASVAPSGSASVPEPSTAWLVVLGALAIRLLRDRTALEY